jgi:transcriptional regulator with XRE-family HTH domain
MAVYRRDEANYNGRMVTRIGPSKPIRHYLKEWRLAKGLTQQTLADRLPAGEDGKPTGKDQVSRWERNERGMTMDVQGALAEALDISPAALFQHPDTPSADELLRRATPEQRERIFAVIETMLKTG